MIILHFSITHWITTSLFYLNELLRKNVCPLQRHSTLLKVAVVFGFFFSISCTMYYYTAKSFPRWREQQNVFLFSVHMQTIITSCAASQQAGLLCFYLFYLEQSLENHQCWINTKNVDGSSRVNSAYCDST